jgi:hypothetical protein
LLRQAQDRLYERPTIEKRNDLPLTYPTRGEKIPNGEKRPLDSLSGRE